MENNEGKNRRYNLVLPKEMHDQVFKLASEHHLTGNALILFCIKFGLFVVDLEEQPDSCLIIEQNGSRKEVKIF